MKRACLLFFAAALIAACDNDNDPQGLSQIDRNFVIVASESETTKVELGQLAVERGGSAEVKAYGSRMVADYSAALAELESLANAKGATMIREPNASHMQLKDTLMLLSGSNFDVVYIESQVEEDEQLANLFGAQGANGRDVDFKNYAAKYLPIANEHWGSSQELKTSLTPTDSVASRKGD